MKKLIFLIPSLFFFAFTTLLAQFGAGSPKVIDEIRSSKLMVVLFDKAPDYNDYIQQYVEKNWKYGDYEFINSDDLDDYKKRKDLFFLSKTTAVAGTPSNKFYNVNLTISRRSKLYYSWGSKYVVVNVPTGYSVGNEISHERFDSFLKVMFDTLEEFEKKKLELFKGKQLAKYYNPQNDVSGFKDKELLIPISSKLYDYKSSEIAKYYTKKFRIVKEGELGELMGSDEGQFIYLHAYQEGPAIIYFLFDIEQNKMVYYGNQPEGVVMSGVTNTKSTYKKMLKDLDEIMN